MSKKGTEDSIIVTAIATRKALVHLAKTYNIPEEEVFLTFQNSFTEAMKEKNVVVTIVHVSNESPTMH